MAAFPTFSGTSVLVTQFPYSEGDDYYSVVDWTEAGFATAAALEATPTTGTGSAILPNERVFTVRYPVMNDTDKAALQAFRDSVGGQVGTFSFTADDGTTYAKCRFDTPDFTFQYVTQGVTSVEARIRALGVG
jgi:hypothetical protein